MADVVVKPAFQSTLPDSGEATKLGPTSWNAARVFSGGVDGDVPVRSAAASTGAAWSSSIASITPSLWFNYAAWGDSLTAGTGGTPYPTQLATLVGQTVYNGGVGGDTSTQIRTRMVADTARLGHFAIIWAGVNNFIDTVTVKADIAAMVAALGHTRFLILSILNGEYTNLYSGQPDYTTLVTLNADLAALYPNNYLDIRAYLVSQYNPGIPQDVIDHGHDITPSSLRFDNLHLLTAGYALVAAQVNAWILAHDVAGRRPARLSDVLGMFTNPPAFSFTTIKAAAGSALDFWTNGVSRWTIDTSGHLKVGVDATYDIGTSTVGPRTGYFATSVVIGNSLTVAAGAITRGTNTANVGISGGTSGASANILLYGGAEATTPNEIRFRQGVSVPWKIATGTGHFLAGTDNTNDIGASGATRPRNIFVGSSLVSKVKAGTPSDTDVTNPADGMMVLDSTASKIWVRLGSAWKGVAVA